MPLLKREMYSDGRSNSIAAESLGQIGAPGVSVLIEALGEKDVRLRYSAMSGLMRAGQAAKPASSALNDQLQDPDEKIRKEAAQVLKMLGSQEQKQ